MMMLPGVEFARKRRMYLRRGLDPPPLPPRPKASACDSSMDEPAVIARRRLEEKLYGSHISATSTSGANAVRRPASSGAVAERKRSGGDKGLGGEGGQADVCAVCLDELRPRQLERGHLKLPCSHKYHTLCVMPWIASHPTCPSCRKAVCS